MKHVTHLADSSLERGDELVLSHCGKEGANLDLIYWGEDAIITCKKCLKLCPQDSYDATVREMLEIHYNEQDKLAKLDNVSSPSHYKAGSVEVIDIIEACELNFSRGNCIKYLARAGKKDPSKELEDLKKAAWYLNREIARLEKK